MSSLKFRKLVIACSILAAFATVTSCSQSNNTAEQGAPEFEVKTLDTSSVTVYTEFSTTIQSQDVIEIKTRITGYVDKVLKKDGSFVKKGELILQIADADYTQKVNAAKAVVQSANAQLANATLEVEKLKPLVEKDIISPYELQSAKSKQDAAKAVLEQSKAEYANAIINLGYTKITSPVDGLLGRIPASVGSLVSASDPEPLTIVSGTGNISAYFSVDEKVVIELRNALPNTNNEGYIELILANGNTYSEKGKLVSASGIIDRATGSIQMKVVFPNPNMQILSGSSGVLRFPDDYNGVITVPQSSTYELQDKIMVYTVEEDNTVKSISLDVIGKTQKEYVVKNLNIGDKIVVGGVTKLRDGQAITPKLN